MGKKLYFLLMGKTGEGKSATGNTLLGGQRFETSSNSTSQTKDVESRYVEIGDYTLKVVDGPGLEDTDISRAEDREAAAKNMDTAIQECCESVDAFLLVIKYGNRFTSEDKAVLEDLKRIFGDKYMDYVIVIVTCGDHYLDDRKYEGTDIEFHEWCTTEKGELRKLYDDCNGRFVLFNNREENEEKNRAQIQEIIQLAQSLPNQNGRYTSKCFQDAKRERDQLILDQKAPQLRTEIQEKLGLLFAEIDCLSDKCSHSDKDSIRKRLQELKNEIDNQDQGFGVLNDLRKLAKQVEDNLDNVTELQKLAIQMEEARKSKKIWLMIGTMVGDAGSALLKAPFHHGGVSLAAGGLLVGGIAAQTLSHAYGIEEDELKLRELELRKRKKIDKN